MTARDELAPETLAALRRDLEDCIEGEVRFERFFRGMHSTDASVYQIIPLGVVAPRSRDDVVRAVELCHKHGASITARGGGTSQAGQAIGPGLLLDFSRHMHRLLELDVSARTVRVEPGLVLDELNARLKPHGLHLPLDLSTANRATIGGMIANNSAGTRSIVYGKTIDYVEELEVVLADGTLITMQPLDDEALREKCSRDDLEGDCYRVVRELGTQHQDEIRRRYPKILRRVGGYNLDEFLPADGPFNLCRIMVGSEGTLGMTVAAKLRLAPLPEHRVVCCVQFADVLEAMVATPVILEHGPSAVELVDRFILDSTRGKIEFEPLRAFIHGDPGAVLIIEFFDESTERIDRLAIDLDRRGLGHYIYRAIDAADQARIWELRKAALGLTMSQMGNAKSISFVEDSAVAPEHLHDYIARFQQILARYEIPSGFYAHASVGLLHIRPVVDMKSADGVEKFAGIAHAVADLVLEYGGALSGEHGDGLVRAPFQEKMFGPVLYQAFCQLKDRCDPEGLFNPGKIVRAPPLTANLRFGPDYKTREPATAFDFSDFGSMAQAAEQCSGVGACRKTLSGAMCPSYMATRDESASTRGRASALRQALSGQFGPEGLDDDELLPILDLCLECKACKRECPTGVDMARLKSEFLHQRHKRHGAALSARLLGRIDRAAAWGRRFAPLVNWIATTGAARFFNQRVLGLDPRRPLPTFARRTFREEWDAPAAPGDIALFADTFSNYFEPEHLHAAARLAGRLSARVELAPRVCCGRPLISKGLLDQAAHQAAATTRALLPLAERGTPILFCEPSCYSAVCDDHPLLLRGAAQTQARQVADACQLFDEWAAVAMQNADLALRSGPRQILVHGHCHQKALVGTGATSALLAAIPDSQITALDSGCCGMAGLFGYEHYELSRAVGERRLFPAVREAGPDTAVVATGFSCRQQIAHFTGVAAHSPATLLEALCKA